MRNRSITTLSSLTLLFLFGCIGENPATTLVAAENQEASSESRVAPLGAPPKTAVATDSNPKGETKTTTTKAKKPRFVPLGMAKKPDDAKMGRGEKLYRAAEAKRLIDYAHSNSIRYAEDVAAATTPEQLEMVSRRAPSAGAVRPSAVVMAKLIAADPTDEPSMDLLVYLAKFVEVPVVKDALAKLSVEASDGSKVPFNTLDLLLEHHTSNPKMVTACRRLPRGENTDVFLKAVFEKSFNPEVRWSSGAQLISSLRRNDKPIAMQEIVVAMSEDRYLDGVKAGTDTTARGWALDKLREIRTLGVGNVLPDVSGERMDGGTGEIADYRGKVVVLDVWTTWCGPCVKMIPHNLEMVERLADKPFAFLNVSCDAKRETLEEFMKTNSMPWDHWWVGSGSKLGKTLNIRAYPQVFVLDRKGVIRYKNIKGKELDEAVDALLAEKE